MIGALRHRVVIEQPVRTQNDSGGWTTVWTEVATVWASVEPLSGGEQLRAMQLEEKISHRVTIRHRTGITAKMRLNFGGRLFNIRSALDRKERGRWLDILADEGIAV